MCQNIVFFNEDNTYLKRFFNYYESHNNFLFSLRCFSSINELKDFCKNKAIDILVSDEKHYEDLKSDIYASKYLCLFENPIYKNKDNEIYISKFQSASDILSILSSQLNTKNNKNLNKSIRMISIFTPAAISATTRLSINISSILEKQENSLYISLDEIPLINEILSDENEKGISELLFFFKEKSLDPAIIRKYILKRRNLRFIPGFKDPNDLNIPSDIELIDFIKFIGKHSECRNIIVQCNNSISRNSSILKISDIIFMPVKSDYINKLKIHLFKNLVKKNNLELYKKLIDVPIPSSIEDSKELLLNISGDKKIYEIAKKLINEHIQ